MKLIKKKCPYCGAELEYSYGDHEARCKYCKQSLIVEYEKLPFTEVKAMLDYYKAKKRLMQERFNTEMCYVAQTQEEYDKFVEEVHQIDKRIDVCEKMLDEAMEYEIERRT
jgi:DNA-directed RNA polymerase subunit RPC12/RpoP